MAASPEIIRKAARLIQAGELVAFPTETVYGLGADATNDRAVAKIFTLKGRPTINPLIVHFADIDAVAGEVEWTGQAQMLAEKFWPGPLTLVMRRRTDCSLSLLVSAGLDTVGVRQPGHELALSLLGEADRPIAAPSANPSGRISPTRAEHVRESLGDGLGGDGVGAILDGGACRLGVESTVLDLSTGSPAILRPGGVPAEELEPVLGKLDGPDRNEPVKSPGSIGRHYATNASLRLNAERAEAGETLLAFGPETPENALNLSVSGDLEEAAGNLFSMLRARDVGKTKAIAVMAIPELGLGRAINDRLSRAAEDGE